MKRLTILSHNVFWFQGVPFHDDLPPDPVFSVMQSLVSVYRTVDPDIVCLQEIQSPETFEMVSGQLGFTGCFCAGNELAQYGTGCLWDGGGCHQHSDSKKTAFNVQRAWQVCEIVLGDNLLRICNLHLPSGRQLGREQSAEQRISELNGVIRYCDAGPDIVVGDFNECPGGGICEYMAEKGYVDTAVVMNAGDRPTNIGGNRGDYIWIKANLSDRLRKYDVFKKEKFKSNINGKQFLSDHLPLWIVMEA